MNFKTHVFDLDGVLLNSNASKSQAFYDAALPYGEDVARAMVVLHQNAGSISRRERWERFFAEVLQRESEDGELDRVIQDCTARVLQGVVDAERLPGVDTYLRHVSGTKVCVSGVETYELRRILKSQGIADSFAHVFGGPKHKNEVLKRLVSAGTIELPAVYYGDTQDDYEAATEAGLEFVFVYGASEFGDWRSFFYGKDVKAIRDFRELLPASAARRVRVDRNGYADIRGSRVFMGTTLAGAEVMVTA